MFQTQISRSFSYRESVKSLEADIHHANTLAAAISRVCGGSFVQMRLSYSPIAPIFLFLIKWMHCSCAYSLPNYLGLFHILIYKVYVDGKSLVSSHERKASVREFYAVIYPSLQQIEDNLTVLEDTKERAQCKQSFTRTHVEERKKLSDKDPDRDDECGICMEGCSKMVLPNCNHAMCISCFRDWNTRSQSCPFCRGSLKRVRSDDLWVLTNIRDSVDVLTLMKENLRQFYLYIDSLPLIVPDTLFLVYYDYII